MTIEQELQLSYYQQVAEIDGAHCIYLVQDVRSKNFFVKKLLTVYNADIYRYLMAHPIPNTPAIILVEEADKVLTVIEEFIPGDTLEDILAQKGTLAEEQVIDIISQLCAILSSFHSCQPAIVNRDIKPSNIKLSPDGVVKLLDLNAAKWSNDQSDKDTQLLGTQGYAAPEQYGFGPSGVSTDIYSVGVLMNVLLTGELPNKRMAEGRLRPIIGKCVELSPAARYQSIAQLQAVLHPLSGKSAAVPAKSSWRRFLLPGFRNHNVIKWLFSAVGYIFLIFMGMSLQVENAGTIELILNRIAYTAMWLCIVLFNGNYLDIQKQFALTRSKKRWVRWLGMAIVDFMLMLFWVLFMNLILSVLV